MSTALDNFVREKTRHFVGREVLRRASAMVQGWRAEERENARLAKQLTIGLLILAFVSLSIFLLF